MQEKNGALLEVDGHCTFNFIYYFEVYGIQYVLRTYVPVSGTYVHTHAPGTTLDGNVNSIWSCLCHNLYVSVRSSGTAVLTYAKNTNVSVPNANCCALRIIWSILLAIGDNEARPQYLQ